MKHYFTNDELESNIKKTECIIKNKKYYFYTDNGVFSKKGLDYGTRSLLECLPVLSGDILDFGCGYGPIGIITKLNNNCNVDMVDINKRSINLAIKNSELNNAIVNVFYSDIYSNVTKKYDYIITNPPIRVGKEILFKILIGAKEYLNKDGELWFVINKDQGAKSTMKELSKFYALNIIDKNKGFYVILAKNN